MVVIDTTVWIDYLNGVGTPGADWLDRELDRQRLAITDLILCEVLQGIRDEQRVSRVSGELLKLEVFETSGIALAVAAARNYRLLRRRGRTVRTTIDGLIATFCLLHGHALLHNDRDYDAFEQILGLQVVHPS
jgi:predicted nucleic acid-binding protein